MKTILITGVTGHQGGAVAHALQGKGFQLRGLTRTPDSERAAALAGHGVELVKGDLDDEATLRRALAGAWGVFGVQNTAEAGVEREEAQGKRLATLAREAGVEHYVYTSVGSAHKQTGVPHFDNKWRVEERRARMKAVRVLEYGGPLVLNDVPTPTIAGDEILVKVKSTAVNHVDLVKASGTVRQIFPIDLPWTPGHEFSGVIEQIGGDVAGYARGDAVFGICDMGAYAESLAVKPATIVRKPSNLSFEEAASVPVASQTAFEAIFTHGHLEKGQTILIHGGAGAVGAYAVQLASHAGATVIATASGDDEAYVKSLGASQVIDYRKARFEKVLRKKVDVVLDSIGGDTQQRSFLVLKEGGHLVAITQPVSSEETAKHRVSGAMMRLAPSADMLGKIARLLEEKTIRPDIATVYPLQDAAQAWKDIAGNLPGVHGVSPGGPEAARRRSHGKLVLRVA